MTTLSELCDREVINMKTGANLGRVDDLQIEETHAHVQALIIYGRLRWFGLLGREESLIIPWQDIVTIGDDAVSYTHLDVYKRQVVYIAKKFENTGISIEDIILSLIHIFNGEKWMMQEELEAVCFE